jgi:putative chitinase
MNWESILINLGIAPERVLKWAPLFDAHVRPERFSLGAAEIDDFLGQILHESQGLTRLEENLRYTTPSRICAVWPQRFTTLTSAVPFVSNPPALANKVYGGRLGNGADNGDGWKYRGRGLIMATGKENYAQLSDVLGVDLVAEPDLLAQREFALLSAIAWWEGHVPDGVMGDIKKVTRAVNGGQIGLAERAELTDAARESLA